MPTVEERFGNRVRQLRTAKKWSQEELAEYSGLHRTYISSLERGERNVTLKVIEKLANSLNVSIHDLMDI